MDVHLINPSDPKTDRRVAQLEGESWGVYAWSPDDLNVILTEFRSVNESYLWILNLESNSKRLVTPAKHGTLVYNGYLAGFSGDGKGVYQMTDRDSEFLRLVYLDLSSGRYTYLTSHIKSDIEAFALSPDRRFLAFIANDRGFSRLHLLDTGTNREIPLPDVPRGVISNLTWHNNGNHLGFSLSSTTAPGDAYVIDTKQNALVRWTRSSTGSMRSKDMPEPELIKWSSFDGREISGFLCRPVSGSKGQISGYHRDSRGTSGSVTPRV